LAGRGGNLKESLIATNVFYRQPSVDSSRNAIVRVQARRLRAHLRRYYQEEGQNDEIFITVPKGCYIPRLQTTQATGTKLPMTLLVAKPNTISVSPFSDNSPEHDLEYFCRGITEEIACRLVAASNELQIVVLSPAINDSDFPAMRITGSLRKFDEKIRITTHLVGAPRGPYLWSASFDGKLEDGFAIQERVARAVCNFMMLGEFYYSPETM
jgi:serine/threonine-protein kinase